MNELVDELKSLAEIAGLRLLDKAIASEGWTAFYFLTPKSKFVVESHVDFTDDEIESGKWRGVCCGRVGAMAHGMWLLATQ